MRRSNLYILLFFLNLILVSFYNLNSFVGFLYYLVVGFVAVALFANKMKYEYITYYLINSLLTILFICLQSYIYPDSYGTTSLLGSATDDNYFFTLVADNIPFNMYVERDFFYMYTNPYSDFIRKITFHSINYPIDVVFFNSIIASFLVLAVKRLVGLVSLNEESQIVASNLTLFCPFFLMNGGAIFVRDTLVALLFVYSLMCVLTQRRFIWLLVCIVQIWLRPGTGLILAFLSFCFYLIHVRTRIKLTFIIFILILFIFLVWLFYSQIILDFGVKYGITVYGRELYEDINNDHGENAILMFIYNQQFFAKAFLGTVYFFIYPFFYIKFFEYPYFDLRAFLLSVVYPVYMIWVNYRLFILILFRKIFDKAKVFLFLYFLGLALISLYSLETRHKTAILPLVYISIAIYPNIGIVSWRKKMVLFSGSIFVFLSLIVLQLIKA